MSNILVRTIWGALFVGIMIGSFLLGTYSTAVILTLFMAIGLFEFYRFFKENEETNPPATTGIVGGILLFITLLAPSLFDFQLNQLWIAIPVLFLPFFHIIFSLNKNPLADLMVLAFSWLYILLPFYFMFSIQSFPIEREYSWGFILGFFVMVWANDTFAYLSGRFFGKHKLFERISPKKTWQGAIGGFIFTLLFGALYAALFKQDFLFWILAGVVISPMSIFGDLIESRFKRIVNVKDSGTILRGHGGILDRFDAAMYAAPFFYLWMTIYFS
ncbi:MAG TPA: phosphatidate cytidylyltransferase [Brumimicrobium sp.]|nr:phosphatidate cytidylyltransferase [Brumimicrobium sp.]